MKITEKILKKRAKQPLENATYLDLSWLGIGAIEGLQNCGNLQILDLSHNNIEEVEGINRCHHLWNINFSYNQLSSLTELSHFHSLGTTDLSVNNISWKDLVRIQDVTILDLHLHGNPHLEKDPYYRIHVIDCLPHIWMLDGRIITSAERLQVQHFFHDSALSSHPVRRKLSDRPHTSATRQRMNVSSIFGIRTQSLVSKFPRNEIHCTDTDLRRLAFLCENMQTDLELVEWSLNTDPAPLPNFCLRKIVDHRLKEREGCNVLLLLLLASLEFNLPTDLILEALFATKLDSYAGVNTTCLFTLDRHWCIQLVSLLLSASKLDRDMHVEGFGGLYDRLYLCLYYLVSDLIRFDRQNWKKRSGISDKRKNQKLYPSSYLRPGTAPLPSLKKMSYTNQFNQSKKEHRMLLASETILLISIVPSFYKYIEYDPALHTLLRTATNDRAFSGKIIHIARETREHGRDIQQLYKEISEHSIHQIERASLTIRLAALQRLLFPTPGNKYMPTNDTETRSKWKIILNTKNAYPRRPKSAILTSGEHLSSGRRRTYTDMQRGSGVRQVLSCSISADPKVSLGSSILLGPQNMARVIAMPEANIALVQMNSVPASNGSVIIQSKNEEDHYCYVDITKLELDTHLGCWKPRGTVGDKVTLQATSENKRKAASLSRTPDALIFDQDYHKPSNAMRSRTSSQTSGKISWAPRNSPSRPGTSTNDFNPLDGKGHIVDDHQHDNENLPARPLSAFFKEKMNLHLPIQSSDIWTETGSQDVIEESRTATQSILNKVVDMPGVELGLPQDVAYLDGTGVDNDDHTLVEKGFTSANNNREIEPEVEQNNIYEEDAEISAVMEDGLDPDAPEDKHAPEIEDTNHQDAEDTWIENAKDVVDAEINSNEPEPKLQALSDNTLKNCGIKRNRASDLRRRAISARLPKHPKVIDGDPRPLSAVTGARDLRSRISHLYRDDVEMDRPGSASSFQFERTEAWRSSASSSMNLMFEQKSAHTLTFMSVPESRRKTSFHVVALRPTPPQRPSSPSLNGSNKNPEGDEKQPPTTTKTPIIMNLSKDKGIKLASNWLAEGRDLHDEYKKSRVYMSPHVPGYLDGVINQANQKKNVSASLPLTASLAMKLEKLSAIQSHRRVSPASIHLREYLPPGIAVPRPSYKTRFTTSGDVKQLTARYAAVTLIKPQKK